MVGFLLLLLLLCICFLTIGTMIVVEPKYMFQAQYYFYSWCRKWKQHNKEGRGEARITGVAPSTHLGQLLPDLCLGDGGSVGMQHVHNLRRREGRVTYLYLGSKKVTSLICALVVNAHDSCGIVECINHDR